MKKLTSLNTFFFFCDHDLTAVIDRQARSPALQLIFFFCMYTKLLFQWKHVSGSLSPVPLLCDSPVCADISASLCLNLKREPPARWAHYTRLSIPLPHLHKHTFGIFSLSPSLTHTHTHHQTCRYPLLFCPALHPAWLLIGDKVTLCCPYTL